MRLLPLAGLAALASTPAAAAITGISGASSVPQGGRYFVDIQGDPDGGETIGFSYLDAYATNGYDTSTLVTPEDGHIVEIYAPDDPGSYEIVVEDADGNVLGTYAVNVTKAWATLDAPEVAAPGAYLDIGFDGPHGPDDAIRLANFDDPVESYIEQAYATDSPAILHMPTEEGRYEIRYVEPLASGDLLLNFAPIEVDAQSAYLKAVEDAGGFVTLDMAAGAQSAAPFSIDAGALDHTWQVMFVLPGEDRPVSGGASAFVTSRPIEVTAPTAPGEYHVIARDASGLVRARYAVTVAPATATVAFQGVSAGGKSALVAFTGPGALLDKVGFALPGAPPDDMDLAYANASGTSPVLVFLPDKPGRYELRYAQYVDGGFRTLASVPVDLP